MSSLVPDPRPLDHLALRGAETAPALILGERVMGHGALNWGVGQLAAWLAARVAPGERVASWLPKGEAAALLPLACARAGLVHVPVNPQLKRAQVAHVVADSGARLLIANPARLASLAPGDAPAVIDEADMLAQAQALSPMAPSSRDPGELAALLYTSGSTGRPKGVMLSHANLWLGAQSVAHFLALTPEDRVLAVLPLAFDYGQSQLLSTWYAGATVVPHDYLLPRDVLRMVARHGITTLAGVPPLWRQLVTIEGDWSSLTRLTNSGGALDAALVSALRARFPQAAIHAMYGLTEAFRSTSLDPALIDTHPTAVGGAIPFAEIMVVREDGTACDPDEEGELVHAGPLVAQGYWNDPRRSAERFRPAPPQSRQGGIAVWSGDRVRIDGAGLLHVIGRRDAMIKTSGTRVSPQEIEEAATATGLVAEAVALGLPDPALGQAIHLVARGEAEDSAALLAAMARDLPGFMVPRAVHWRAALPLTPNGKIDRQALYDDLTGLADKAP